MFSRLVALLVVLGAALIGPVPDGQAASVLTVAYSSGTAGKYEPCAA